MALDTLQKRIERKQVKRGENECWPWLGYIHPDGEARIWVDDEIGSIPVARAFFLLRDEKIPPDKEVLTCPLLRECSNPAHVSLATREEVADRLLWKKGLIRKRGKIQRALSDEQIRQIYVSTDPIADIAVQFDITEAQVFNIKAGRKYRDITLTLEAARSAQAQ